MKLQSINTTTDLSFGKVGNGGNVLGRTSTKNRLNPYYSKLSKVLQRYKKQVYETYNAFCDNKEIASQEIKQLNCKFNDQISIITGRRCSVYKNNKMY